MGTVVGTDVIVGCFEGFGEPVGCRVTTVPLGLSVNDGTLEGCVDGFLVMKWVPRVVGSCEGDIDGGFVEGANVGAPDDGTLLD